MKNPRGGELIRDEHEVRWGAADADGDPLLVSLDVSNDDGVTWRSLAEDEPNGGSTVWDTRGMPNSPFYRMRLRCTDGSVEVADTSGAFTLQKDHVALARSIFRHVSGDGSGTVGGSAIDSSRLTDHLYWIVFDDMLPEQKAYDVYDLDADSIVVRCATQMDGATEGPIFDGLRLVVYDYPQAGVDQARTGWIVGHTDLAHTISLPHMSFEGEVVRGHPYPADYNLTVHDHVVDTSRAFVGAQPVPLRFTMRNLTEDHHVPVIFVELDTDHLLSPHDQIYVLDEDDGGEFILTWIIFFSGSSRYIPRAPGDQFLLATVKPFTHMDVFEFTTASLRHKGDVNADGTVDILDAVVVIRFIFGRESLVGSARWRADGNEDGRVDVDDVAGIVSVIVGSGGAPHRPARTSARVSLQGPPFG